VSRYGTCVLARASGIRTSVHALLSAARRPQIAGNGTVLYLCCRSRDATAATPVCAGHVKTSAAASSSSWPQRNLITIPLEAMSTTTMPTRNCARLRAACLIDMSLNLDLAPTLQNGCRSVGSHEQHGPTGLPRHGAGWSLDYFSRVAPARRQHLVAPTFNIGWHNTILSSGHDFLFARRRSGCHLPIGWIPHGMAFERLYSFNDMAATSPPSSCLFRGILQILICANFAPFSAQLNSWCICLSGKLADSFVPTGPRFARHSVGNCHYP